MSWRRRPGLVCRLSLNHILGYLKESRCLTLSLTLSLALSLIYVKHGHSVFPKVWQSKMLNFNGEIRVGRTERRPVDQISPLKLVCGGNLVNRDSRLLIRNV